MMKLFNEENPKFQCFNCGAIFKSTEWNKKTNEVYEDNQAILPRDYIKNSHDMTTVGTEESNPNLPSFVCPICESGPMADELIYIPVGQKVVVKATTVVDGQNEIYEYDVYLTENIKPLHELAENPIKDYSDYAKNIDFFESAQEMVTKVKKRKYFKFYRGKSPRACRIYKR